MTRSLLHAANLLVLALLLGVSFFVFDGLPERIPVHFGAGGEPDRYADTTLLSWMLLPLLGVVLTGMMYGLARLIMRMPNHLNMPNQKRYQALPLEAKLQVVDAQTDLFYAISAGLNIMFVMLQAGSYQVAMGEAAGLPVYSWLAIALFVAFSTGLAVVAVSKSSRLVKELSETAADE